jgi:hypothetical protein
MERNISKMASKFPVSLPVEGDAVDIAPGSVVAEGIFVPSFLCSADAGDFLAGAGTCPADAGSRPAEAGNVTAGAAMAGSGWIGGS